MKILYLLHNDPRASGGTEKHALQLAATAAREHATAILYPRTDKKLEQPAISESSTDVQNSRSGARMGSAM